MTPKNDIKDIKDDTSTLKKANEELKEKENILEAMIKEEVMNQLETHKKITENNHNNEMEKIKQLETNYKQISQIREKCAREKGDIAVLEQKIKETPNLKLLEMEKNNF